MLMIASYSKDYVGACRAKVAAQLAGYREMPAAKPAGDRGVRTRRFWS
jgi:hypothetical protein